MNKLSNVSKIYDEVEKSEAFIALEDSALRKNSETVKESLDRLEMNRPGLSQEASAQADQATQNAMTAQRLREEVEITRRTSQSSMQNLQMLNVSFGNVL